jgi:hypothetical protein
MSARSPSTKFENFLVREDRVLVKSLISNKGAKINEIETLYGVIKQRR